MRTMDDVDTLTRFDNGGWTVKWRDGIEEPIADVALSALLNAEMLNVLQVHDRRLTNLERHLAELQRQVIDGRRGGH